MAKNGFRERHEPEYARTGAIEGSNFARKPRAFVEYKSNIDNCARTDRCDQCDTTSRGRDHGAGFGV